MGEVILGQVATLSYAGPAMGTCPLCQKRPVGRKTLFGQAVCKKCLYGFANRRQFAFIIDLVVVAAVGVPIGVGVGYGMQSMPLATQYVIEFVFGALVGALFTLRDGFAGQSPGKRLMGVQVVDVGTGKPIGFGQSFKRNVYQMVGDVPVIGPLLGFIALITIALQMIKGPRMGDGLGKTRVIWKQYYRSRVFGGDELACEGCGYDLTGNTSGNCPECGKGILDEGQRRAVATTVEMVK